jgi:hypothetical protein
MPLGAKFTPRGRNHVVLTDFRERVESLEKEIRIKSLQRSPGHSHSHDSAIDSDLQEWETETVDLNLVSSLFKCRKGSLLRGTRVDFMIILFNTP